MHPFQGHPDFFELDCSGRSLDGDSDLLTLVLYLPDSDRVLASVNLKNSECYTSSLFSACFIDRSNWRASRLKTLLTDLPEGQTRVFACNATSFRSDGRLTTVTWRSTVVKRSEYILFVGDGNRKRALLRIGFACVGPRGG